VVVNDDQDEEVKNPDDENNSAGDEIGKEFED
jgi:hypothetical protein